MLFGAMPRLSPAIFGIWVMNGRQNSEKTKIDDEAAADHPVVAGDLDAFEQAVQALGAAGRRFGQRHPRQDDDDHDVAERR